MIIYPQAPFRYRRKGLPKRLKRIPGGVPGLTAACNIEFHFGQGEIAAKVAFFKDRKSMRHFYDKILPRYRSAWDIKVKPLTRKCAGCVHRLEVGEYDVETDEVVSIEVDRRYFCIVLLCEGDLTAEVLAHEAVHVGFAWDARTRGEGGYADRHNFEENVAYPAGVFLDQVLSFIKKEGLREV